MINRLVISTATDTKKITLKNNILGASFNRPMNSVLELPALLAGTFLNLHADAWIEALGHDEYEQIKQLVSTAQKPTLFLAVAPAPAE